MTMNASAFMIIWTFMNNDECLLTHSFLNTHPCVVTPSHLDTRRCVLAHVRLYSKASAVFPILVCAERGDQVISTYFQCTSRCILMIVSNIEAVFWDYLWIYENFRQLSPSQRWIFTDIRATVTRISPTRTPASLVSAERSFFPPHKGIIIFIVTWPSILRFPPKSTWESAPTRALIG